MGKRFDKLPTALKIFFSFIVLTLLLPLLGPLSDAAFQGIVGDVATSLSHTVWDIITSPQNIVLLLIIIAILVTLCVALLLYHNHSIKSLEIKYQTQSDLFTLEDTLVRLLPSLLQGTNTEKEMAMRRLIEKLLVDAIKILSDHVASASLYLPDQSNELLKIWESHGVPRESLRNAQCYIGPPKPGTVRGVAAEAFMGKEIFVAHQTGEKKQDGSWKFDRESFIDFDGSQVPPYFSALVCVPLIDRPGSAASRGVICFDSKQKNTFDSPEMRERLRLIGRCFTSALLTYQEITHSQLIP